MAAAVSTGYTRLQVILHWAVVVLIAFQYLGSDGIEQAYRAYRDGSYVPGSLSGLGIAHIVSGVLVLIFAIWRLVLRAKYGAPPPPASEPPLLKLLAHVTHFGIYALIIILPLSGMAGWGGEVAQAITVHKLAKTLLLVLIVLHVAGALVHQFVWKTDVLKRMTHPAR